MFKPSIRSQLVFIAVLAVAPAFLFFILGAQEYRRLLRQEAEHRALETVVTVGHQAERKIENARGFLEGLAVVPILDRDHIGKCNKLLGRLLESNIDYANIGVVDGSGKLFCSALPYQMDLDLSDRLYIRKAQETGAFSVGGFMIGRVTGKSSLNMGIPLSAESGGKPPVLYVALDLEKFGEWVATAGLPEGSSFTVLDQDGLMLARYPKLDGWVGKSVKDSELSHVRSGKREGTAVAKGLDGVNRIYAFGPLGDAEELKKLDVIVGIPSEHVYGPINSFYRQGLIGISVVAVLAILVAWVVGDRFIARRINRLAHSAESMGRGALSERTGIAGDGDEIAVLAGAMDRMAESLERLSGETRLIMESANEGICGLDPDGKVVFANSASGRILGYEPGEMTGTDLCGMAMAPSGGEETPSGILTQSAGKGLLSEEFRRKDGSLCPVEMTVSILNRGTEPVGYLVIFADVSNRRRLEEQLEQSRRMEAVGRLAGGVAHDFNNLLTLINGNAQIIQSEAMPDTELYRDVSEIVEASRQAAAVTRQLLLFSRHQVDQTRPIDLNDLLARTLRLVRKMIGEHIRIATGFEQGIWPVKANAGQIEQVIMNLTLNSADAMRIGGTLSLGAHNIEILEGVSPPLPELTPGRYVELTVADTGQGMDKEILAHVFEPFYTTKEKGKGTGLGLSVVYGIVKSLHGAIGIESESGRGTTVRLYFPATDEIPRDTARVLDGARGSGQLILVVEDDPRVRNISGRLLRRLGYEVIEASGGEHALMLLGTRADEVSLLYTDMLMPGMDGEALCAEVRKRYPRIRTLLTSGYAGSLQDGNNLPPHIDGFLAKPYNVTELASKLAILLRLETAKA